mmetsp:Transcript_11228/g.15676  ORF Transcript_11228/g.15676 Transcript_11228/m.15676 type:complete len:184 (-) Transcript_11228:151-702(-)
MLLSFFEKVGFCFIAFRTLIGLDGSGKTTIRHRIRTFMNDAKTRALVPLCAPSCSQNSAELMYKSRRITIVDNPGKYWKRAEWLSAARKADVIVYVIDSTDEIRFELANEELVHTFQEDTEILIGRKLIILFSKKESPRAFSSTHIIDRIGDPRRQFPDSECYEFSAHSNDDVEKLINNCMSY